MRSIPFFLLLLTAMADPAGAQERVRPEGREALRKRLLERFDRNGDLRLDREELGAVREALGRFRERDDPARPRGLRRRAARRQALRDRLPNLSPERREHLRERLEEFRRERLGGGQPEFRDPPGGPERLRRRNELRQRLREHGPELRQRLREHGPELRQRLREHGPELRQRLRDLREGRGGDRRDRRGRGARDV